MRATRYAFWTLAALLALAAGCGIDDAPVARPLRQDVELLIDERSYVQSDVEISEQVYLTNADRSQVYHLRARLTNLGADRPGTRYELLFARERDRIGGTIEQLPPVVVATQELGTLFSSQTAIVSLEAREFGGTRVRPLGRLVFGP